MSKKILYLKLHDAECREIISELQKNDYEVVEQTINEETLKEIGEILNKDFYYFTLSNEFYDGIYKVCINTATKYVTCIGPVQQGVVNYYTLLQKTNIFNAEEEKLYRTINELFLLHKDKSRPKKELRDLNGIEDEEEIKRLTDQYFFQMESEQKLCFQLKEQLMEYIDCLLEKRVEDSWREIVLWNKRHECRTLCNRFWQFYLLQKASSIFAEEMIQYYESGESPSIVQFGSFKELSEAYFHLLLLLRRLNYDVATEEEADIVAYIMEKNVSGIFIRHVIEQNQIEDKEKVYQRLEELLIKYEQQ